MSASVLHAIMAGARTAALERSKATRAQVDRAAALASPFSSSFAASLRTPGVRIIAECKRRSPSRGILRRDYDPAAIAAGYAHAGAAAVSVLTEPTFFDGHLDHLRAVRAQVPVPLLRKDFISTEFQVAEARAAGANAILLIVAGLEDWELGGMIASAAAHELDALVEVHTRSEAQRAIDHGAAIIGVNSRDLRTLQVSPSVFEDVLPVLPQGCVKVAESGITSLADVRRVKEMGFDACLIGERFMTSEHPGFALAQFLAGVTSGATS